MIVTVIIATTLVLLSALYLIEKAQKWVKPLYRKWIKGECRHICFICEHLRCKYETGLCKEYTKDFDLGYRVGYDDAIRQVIKKFEQHR